jgi:hypothetical protein
MNRDLTLLELTNNALVASMDMGFNCAQVERWNDSETFEPKIAILFGDREKMEKSRLPVRCDAVRSYSFEVPCTREPRRIPFDVALLACSTDAIRHWVTDMLLEIA